MPFIHTYFIKLSYLPKNVDNFIHCVHGWSNDGYILFFQASFSWPFSQRRHLGGGLGGRRPPPRKKKKRKKEKKKEKRKKEKEKRKKEKGTMNSVKLLHIKCCFFQFFNSPVALKKKFGPPRKSWNDAPTFSRWFRPFRWLLRIRISLDCHIVAIYTGSNIRNEYLFQIFMQRITYGEDRRMHILALSI